MMFDDAYFERAAAFELVWKERVGGDATEDMRFMLGMLCARIVAKGVKPDDLAEYVSLVVRADGQIPPTLKTVP